MIVHGGEPPFIEDPEPRFGSVIEKLNELAFYVQEQTENYNAGTKDKLLEFATSMAAFVNEVTPPITAHLTATGAQHGETAKTVGLGLKDNFRTATLAEQQALADVDAFMTPQGVKAALANNSSSFNTEAYQKNDVLQVSSYFFPDDYPRLVPSRPEPPRYLGTDGYNGRVPMLFNGDRMVFSPRCDPERYEGNVLYVSGPTKVAHKTQLEEITNIKNYYTGLGWNNVAATSSAGTVSFFHPLADKNIYEFKNNTGLPAAEAHSFLLYRGYGGVVYKGIAVSVTQAAPTTLTINHRIFNVNLLETDPTMVNLVDGAYPAVFQSIAGNSAGSVQGSHNLNVLDFLTLPPGAVVTLDGDAQGATCSLFWNTQDYEAYLFIAASLAVTLPSGAKQYITLRFVESIIPGTLRTDGSATFRVLGTYNKDVIPDTLVPAEDAQWCEPSNRWNINSPVHLPGCVLQNGEVVKSRAGKYGMRVKRHLNALLGLKDWITGPRPVVDIKNATTEIMTPSRHSPFTALPERIIPITHSDQNTTYLVYGLDLTTGRHIWQELSWNSGNLVSVATEDRFGIRLPATTTKQNKLITFPQSISTYVSSSGNGVATNALCFTTTNGYKGHTSFQYEAGLLTLGATINLSPLSLLALQSAAGAVLDRAKTFNPALNTNLRKVSIQVFALTANKAVYLITDGMSYAEAGVTSYTIVDGVFVLDFDTSSGVSLTRVTEPVATQAGVSRESLSGDGTRMDFNDLMAIQQSPSNFSVVATRAYGNVYGDLSFSISDLTEAEPIITGGRSNAARLYMTDLSIDTVDEIFPALLIPNKGLYQYDPTTDSGYTTLMYNVIEPDQKVDPFDINEAGWVHVPAGAKLILNGRTYVLDQDFAVKVNPTGTTYCYLVRNGDVLSAIGSTTLRESANNEVMFGKSVNGVLEINHSYLVMDKHVVSAIRLGSAIPCFEDNGANGVNQFFTQRDRI